MYELTDDLEACENEVIFCQYSHNQRENVNAASERLHNARAYADANERSDALFVLWTGWGGAVPAFTDNILDQALCPCVHKYARIARWTGVQGVRISVLTCIRNARTGEGFPAQDRNVVQQQRSQHQSSSICNGRFRRRCAAASCAVPRSTGMSAFCAARASCAEWPAAAVALASSAIYALRASHRSLKQRFVARFRRLGA